MSTAKAYNGNSFQAQFRNYQPGYATTITSTRASSPAVVSSGSHSRTTTQAHLASSARPPQTVVPSTTRMSSLPPFHAPSAPPMQPTSTQQLRIGMGIQHLAHAPTAATTANTTSRSLVPFNPAPQPALQPAPQHQPQLQLRRRRARIPPPPPPKLQAHIDHHHSSHDHP